MSNTAGKGDETVQQDRLQNGTGWPALAKLVRGMDEDKIRDCKEDIDTLLVFAGLFSAVMTAFIIESYKDLQQDPATVSVELLRQIALQTSPEFAQAGTTQSSIVDLPFEPSPSAVQVNVLWFASLLLSLVTASIGILLKQWLREYLGGEYVTPQAQLRIRHFRYPGLGQWKIFEIAAFLPLLLQISLALFFAGLCIFTASVHPSIGRTTLPVVVCWAAFVFATTISPVFSTRCPYKTPFLKHFVKAIRPRVRSLWSRKKALMRNLLSRADDWPRGSTVDDHKNGEEKDVVATDSNDIDILGAIDAVLLDDYILETTILTSLQESELSGQATVIFLLDVIARRLPADANTDLAARLPAVLHALSYRVWASVMRAVIDILRRKLQEDANSIVWRPWMDTAILLLLSPCHLQQWSLIADDVSDIVRKAVLQSKADVCRIIASAFPFGRREPGHEVAAGRLLNIVGDAVGRLEEDQDNVLGFSCLEDVVGRRIYGHAYQMGMFQLSEFLHSPWGTFTLGNLRDLAITVVSMLLKQMENHRTPAHNISWMPNAVSFMVNTMSVMGDYSVSDRYVTASRTRLAAGFHALLTHRDASHTVFVSLAQIPPASFQGENFIISAVQTVYLRDRAGESTVNNFILFMDTKSAEEASPIRLAFLAIRAIKLPEALRAQKSWSGLFSALAVALTRNAHRHPADNEALAERCMAIVHALEYSMTDMASLFDSRAPARFASEADSRSFPMDDEEAYSRWRSAFDPDRSLFPNEFISALSTLAFKESRWYRVRRLKELHQDDRVTSS